MPGRYWGLSRERGPIGEDISYRVGRPLLSQEAIAARLSAREVTGAAVVGDEVRVVDFTGPKPEDVQTEQLG